MTKRVLAQPHVYAKGLRVGVGSTIHESGVTDVLAFGFDGWVPTEVDLPDGEGLFIVGLPINAEGVRALAGAFERIAHFLETGEAPHDAEPM